MRKLRKLGCMGTFDKATGRLSIRQNFGDTFTAISDEACDCRYCLRRQKGIGCAEDKYPFMKERITAGSVYLHFYYFSKFFEVSEL